MYYLYRCCFIEIHDVYKIVLYCLKKKQCLILIADEESMAVIAKALSHPVRLKILKLLAMHECYYTGHL